jgi:hypothetical protein
MVGSTMTCSVMFLLDMHFYLISWVGVR